MVESWVIKVLLNATLRNEFPLGFRGVCAALSLNFSVVCCPPLLVHCYIVCPSTQTFWYFGMFEFFPISFSFWFLVFDTFHFLGKSYKKHSTSFLFDLTMKTWEISVHIIVLLSLMKIFSIFILKLYFMKLWQ